MKYLDGYTVVQDETNKIIYLIKTENVEMFCESSNYKRIAMADLLINRNILEKNRWYSNRIKNNNESHTKTLSFVLKNKLKEIKNVINCNSKKNS